jgi:hypothetical protein
MLCVGLDAHASFLAVSKRFTLYVIVTYILPIAGSKNDRIVTLRRNEVMKQGIALEKQYDGVSLRTLAPGFS